MKVKVGERGEWGLDIGGMDSGAGRERREVGFKVK